MRHHKKSILALILAAILLVPTKAFAIEGGDEGDDSDYCQSALSDPGTPTYTIHFETYGGTTIPDALIVQGCSLREMDKIPDDPLKDDHTFFGWFSDSSFENKYISGLVPEGDMTLYAQFIPNENVIYSVNLNVNAPIGGNQVTVKYVTEQGAVFEEQSSIPMAFVEEYGANYWSDYTGWVTGEGSFTKFEGTFVAGQDYWAQIDVGANEGYKFAPNITASVNGAPATIAVNEYSRDDWASIFAKVTALNGEEYVIEDESGNSITFNEEEGHDFHLSVQQFSFSMTDEQLATFDPPISREEYEAGKSIIINAVKDQGSVIAYFEIDVYEIDLCGEDTPCMCETDDGEEVPCQHNLHDGPFEIKIKFTDEMAGFDSYKLVYVEMTDDGVTSVEEAVELTLVDGYLVGTIPHLSGYVLIGSMNPDAPYTGSTTKSTTNANISYSIVSILATIIILAFAAKKTKR